MPTADPQMWFLGYSSTNFNAPNGDGRPWGDGTNMAERARLGVDPWDSGCRVTTFTSGFAAMSAMRDTLEKVIEDARQAPVGVPRGHVYISDWRFNCLRDLSEDNAWKLDPWTAFTSGFLANRDQSAMGLVLRLMQAGVAVRMLLWLPIEVDRRAGFGPQIEDHYYAARLVAAESEDLTTSSVTADQRGIVGLDLRTAARVAASHHQKTMVIRSINAHVAFVGGVDLAYTRRDPARPDAIGDWQSGEGIPEPRARWPKQPLPVNYDVLARVKGFSARQPTDLPPEVYGDGKTPLNRQRWHDQHLMLEGPVVTTLEWQFAERWRDTARIYHLGSPFGAFNWGSQQVIFSTSRAFLPAGIEPLPIPQPTPAPAGAGSQVQMWRTIPLRESRSGAPFRRGEFTVMAGTVRAVKAATELIWIFDQYFWSRAFARLVNQQLKCKPSLRVIVVLPPHADGEKVGTAVATVAHQARFLALNDLTAGLSKTGAEYDQVGAYDLWHDPKAPVGTANNRGIYVHAKAQTYDGSLLVCGSANLNRRSFLCDTELACAVLDPAVVVDHQTKLWALLFRGATRPSVDLNSAGGGKRLFDLFRAAVKTGPSILIPDPWQDPEPTLPNNVKRAQSLFPDDTFDAPYPPSTYSILLDPSSVTDRVESELRDSAGGFRKARLDDIVRRLEEVYTPSGDFPYRQTR